MNNNINYGNKINSGILKEKNQFKGINMSQLTDIIAYAKTSGAPEIATMLQEYYAKEKQRRSFGLTYEHHMPEVFEISHHKIRKGDIVSLRSERGKFAPTDSKRWLVTKVYDYEGEKVANLQLAFVQGMIEQEEIKSISLDKLIKTVSQNEVIYPGLEYDGEVIGDKNNDTFHSVICSENYDTLRMLTSTDLIGKVDCIYIDPPYNTGSKDWIYNNDYVDGSDEFRSSAFMNFLERRLLEAKTLLNPDDSVLIVTIDEKEYLNVGMLLRQVFPGAKIQMVSSVINPRGVTRSGTFYRTNEYIYTVQIGKSEVLPISLNEKWRTAENTTTDKIHWQSLRRAGKKGQTFRHSSPGCFYPIFINEKDNSVHSVGEALPLDISKDTVNAPEGTIAIWPMRADGKEGCYQTSPENLRELISQGFVRINSATTGGIYYLKRGEREKVISGRYKITGYRENDGSVEVENVGHNHFIPSGQWNIPSHNAGENGASVINSLHGEKRFDFPKSLYAVEDVLRFFIKNKPDATIIDFFGGSGTTTHAVMRLNEQDGGNRRSITITNNEISLQNNKKFSTQGLQSGDPDWEKYGVYEYATKPRLTAAITGKTAKSNFTEDVEGYYKYNDFQDEYPIGDPIPKDKAKQYKDGMKQNVRFFYLDYLKYNDIYLGLSDNELYSIIWLEQGQKGEIPQDIDDFYIGHSYAILKKMSKVNEMLDKIDDNIRTIYVHGDEKTAQQIHKSVSPEIDVIPLWDLYIDRMKSQTIK